LVRSRSLATCTYNSAPEAEAPVNVRGPLNRIRLFLRRYALGNGTDPSATDIPMSVLTVSEMMV